MPGFAASSKLLQKKWEQRRHNLHLRKVQSMRAGLDNATPKSQPHLIVRLKKIQKEEEKQADIDRNNQLLLQKLSQIMRSRGQLDNWNDYHTKSLNKSYRNKQQEQIAIQNFKIAKHLESIRPMYKVRAWEDDFNKHEQILENMAATTKDFDKSPREHVPHRKPKPGEAITGFQTTGDDTKYTSILPNIDIKDKPRINTREPPGVKLPNIRSRKEGKRSERFEMYWGDNLKKRPSWTGRHPKRLRNSRVRSRYSVTSDYSDYSDSFESYYSDSCYSDDYNSDSALNDGSITDNIKNAEPYKNVNDPSTKATLPQTQQNKLNGSHVTMHSRANIARNNAKINNNVNRPVAKSSKAVTKNSGIKSNIDNGQMTDQHKEVYDETDNSDGFTDKDAASTPNDGSSLQKKDNIIKRNIAAAKYGHRRVRKRRSYFRYRDAAKRINNKTLHGNIAENRSPGASINMGKVNKSDVINGNDLNNQGNRTKNNKTVNKDSKELTKPAKKILPTPPKAPDKRKGSIVLKNNQGAEMQNIHANVKRNSKIPVKSSNVSKQTIILRKNDDVKQKNNVTNDVQKKNHIGDTDIKKKNNAAVKKKNNITENDVKNNNVTDDVKRKKTETEKNSYSSKKVIDAKSYSKPKVPISNSTGNSKQYDARKHAADVTIKSHAVLDKKNILQNVNHKKANTTSVKKVTTGKIEEIDTVTVNNIRAANVTNNLSNPEKLKEAEDDASDAVKDSGFIEDNSDAKTYASSTTLDTGSISSKVLISKNTKATQRDVQMPQRKMSKTKTVESHGHVHDEKKDSHLGHTMVPHAPHDSRPRTDVRPSHKTKRDPYDPQEAVADQDARLLYKVVKNMAKADDILLKTMIRKSHDQRLHTRDHFEELYDLNLKIELQDVLGEQFHTLIDCLLVDKHEDEIYTLKHAILGNDPATVIQIISTKSHSEMTRLSKEYKRYVDKTIEGHIQESILDEECQMLLQTILREDRPWTDRVDDLRAMKDAEELYEYLKRSGEGRFTSDRGKFMRIITERSFSQIRQTLQNYLLVTGGMRVTDSMRYDGCSPEFIHVVDVLGRCLSTDPGYWAEKLHASLGPNNAQFINILLDRAETDLPAVRKAYKRLYNVTLSHEIDQYYDKDVASLLQQIAGKNSDNVREYKSVPLANKPNDKARRRTLVKNDSGSLMKDSPLANAGNSASHNGKRNIHSKSTATSKPTGTVKPVKPFDVEVDVERFRKAVDLWGTNEDQLIYLLVTRSNTQRQIIKKKYLDKYRMPLSDDLDRTLGQDFEEIIQALLLHPIEYDAYSIHKALLNTQHVQQLVVAILASRTAKELRELQTYYETTFHGSLRSDILEHAKGDFGKLLVEMLHGDREPGTVVNRNKANIEARTLYKDRQYAINPTHQAFIHIITRYNFNQLRLILDEYEKITGHTVAYGIKRSKVGNAEPLYISLVEALRDPASYLADCAYTSMIGIATNDTMLIQTLVPRAETDLVDIKERYFEKYGTSLSEDIEGKCQSNCKYILLALLEENKNQLLRQPTNYSLSRGYTETSVTKSDSARHSPSRSPSPSVKLSDVTSDNEASRDLDPDQSEQGSNGIGVTDKPEDANSKDVLSDFVKPVDSVNNLDKISREQEK